MDGMDVFEFSIVLERRVPMRKYHAEMPLFHVYDDELTGTQKLLMFLLYADNTLDVYTLGYLARMRTEDVLFDLKELEKRGYLQSK